MSPRSIPAAGTFGFPFPEAFIETERLTTPGERTLLRGAPKMELKRILIYADRKFPAGLREILHRRGFTLEEATEAGVLAERAERERPHVVIAFGKMKGGSGLELCRRLKGKVGPTETAVLVLSLRKSDERQVYYEAGCDGFYHVPFDEVSIAKRIEDLVYDRSSARQLATARLAIDYKVNSEVFTGGSQELHDGTIFLHARHPLDQGSHIKLTLSVAGKTLIDAHGEVVRSDPFRGSSSTPSGMAVRLYDLGPDGQQFLDSLRRQRLVAGRLWEGVDTETVVERIGEEVASGAAPGPPHVLLTRAGYPARPLHAWEAAAFEATDEEDDEGSTGALREGVGLIYKLTHLAAECRGFVYLSETAGKRLQAHVEKVVSRAEAVADVLLSLADRAAQEGRAARAEELGSTQGDILQRMVDLRTALADLQRSSRDVSPSVTVEMLGASEDLQKLLRGLAELFDFPATFSKKPHAQALDAEIDLTELSSFSMRCFMEDPANATSIPPDLCLWTRVLAARRLEIGEFLKHRRPGRERRPDRVEEVLEFGESAIGGLLAAQELLRGDLRRFAGRGGRSREFAAEVAAVNHQALGAAARLHVYYRQHAEEGASDYKLELVQAASEVAAIVAPKGGTTPLRFPEPAAGASPSPLVPDQGGRDEKEVVLRPRLLERLGPVGAWIERVGGRRVVLGVVVAVVVVGAGVAYKLSRVPSHPGPKPVAVGRYRSLLPLTRCEVRAVRVARKDRRRTLHCVVDDKWAQWPEGRRRQSLLTLFSMVLKEVRVDRVLLVNKSDYTLGYAEGAEVEIYSR